MFSSWRNWRSMRFTTRGVAVLFGAVVLPLAYVTTHPAATPQPVETAVNYYESPCYYQARTSRGIPPLTVDQSKGLVAWERANAGTAQAADFHTALRTCDQVAPVARWDFDAMHLAHSEVVR